MPRTIARATASASRGLIAAEIRAVSSRLELVLAVEAGRPGVGRVRARDHDPVRHELGAQRLGETADRELRRRVRGVAEDPEEPAVDDTEHEVAAAACSIIDGTTARIACSVPK